MTREELLELSKNNADHYKALAKLGCEEFFQTKSKNAELRELLELVAEDVLVGTYTYACRRCTEYMNWVKNVDNEECKACDKYNCKYPNWKWQYQDRLEQALKED